MMSVSLRVVGLSVSALLAVTLACSATRGWADDVDVSEDVGSSLALQPSLDFQGWRADGALGHHFSDGNSNVSLFSVDLRFEGRDAHNLIRVGGDTSYGKDSGDTNVNRSGLITQYQRLYGDRWYAGMGLKLQRDDFAEVDYRLRLNPAAGYYLAKSKSLRANIEVGPSYVFEEVLDREDSYLAPRLGQRVEWVISPSTKIYEEAECLLDSSNADNTLVEVEVGIDAAVSSDWGLRVSAKTLWDGEPATGKQERDTQVITSLVYKIQSFSSEPVVR